MTGNTVYLEGLDLSDFGEWFPIDWTFILNCLLMPLFGILEFSFEALPSLLLGILRSSVSFALGCFDGVWWSYSTSSCLVDDPFSPNGLNFDSIFIGEKVISFSLPPMLPEPAPEELRPDPAFGERSFLLGMKHFGCCGDSLDPRYYIISMLSFAVEPRDCLGESALVRYEPCSRYVLALFST